jgi:hypothetical protein
MRVTNSRSSPESSLIPLERIERSILLIRGVKVILDADLAQVYGVSTKAFNQAVKRNKERFPDDFTFRLTKEEKREVVTNCDHLQRLRYSPVLPAAFTEHGAVMAATVLNSDRAIKLSIFVVRAFLKFREMLGTQNEFARKLGELEKKFAEHDKKFRVVFEAIRELMQPTPVPPKRRIGFAGSKEEGQ